MHFDRLYAYLLLSHDLITDNLANHFEDHITLLIIIYVKSLIVFFNIFSTSEVIITTEK